MSEDIFEKYAELAMERGLVSKGDDLKKKLEKNPRWDSQDISTIELLYGVKPDSPKEMEYKKNIVEIAHPNAVIVSPAHDPLNGLVENLNERNNILINIVNKTPDGHLTGRKYASDELVRSLVRIANEMDNRDSEELRVLADTCIEQMNKQALSWKDVENFFSERGGDVVDTAEGVGGGAAAGAIIGGILGGIAGWGVATPATALLGAKIGGLAGGALGGLVASIAKTSPQAQNVSLNASDALSKLNTLIEDFPGNTFLKTFAQKLVILIDFSKKYAQLSNNPTGKMADTAEAHEISANYVKAMEEIKTEFATFEEKVKQGEFAEDSSIAKIKTFIHLFKNSTVEAVEKSIESLIRVIDKAEEGMNGLKTNIKAVQQAPVAQTTSAPAPPEAIKTKQEKDEFAELAELLKKYPQLSSMLSKK